MATYFPSSNNRREIAPMLYSETQILSGNGIMYMNYPSTSGSYSDTLAVNSQQQNSCIDNLPVGALDANASQQEFLSNLGGSRIGDQVFNAWRDGRNEMHPIGGPTSILQNGQSLQGQGLSLSLSPQIPSGIQIPSVQYQNPILGFSFFSSPNSTISRNGCSREDDNSQNKESQNTECMQPGFQGSNLDPMKDDVSQYGIPSIARTIANSKYLKAAQQLLEEVVNIRKALKQHDSKKEFMTDSTEVETSMPPATGASSNPQESTSNAASELSAVGKQDLQNKMTKLFSMLDEVERRFKQYYHQMQIVVSLFDVIAGCGAAKPYTALALQTISRHFRCLRDAINGQIQVTQRSLGEQDGSTNSKGVGISRLRYVEQQLRQQRALQQLGMTQQHTWRPQRGLPETSVSILRAWLFEHFLHPYPKDSEKIMLARQTGLTRSQVSNWFINARVRLWKPMVEDMYNEEAEANAKMDSLSSSEITPKATKCDMKAVSEDRGEDVQQSATERYSTGQLIELKSDHPSDVEMMVPSTDSSFHNVTRTETETRKLMGGQRPSVDDFSLFGEAIVQSNAYHLARFGNGNGVSLTLGLQHCEDGTRHNFVTMRGDDVYNVESSPAGPKSADFDCTDSGNRQHMFGSSHLLHDFKA